MRILCNHAFFGLLLMHLRYAVDEEEETASTDGVRITFGTDFLDELSDSELDFVMMHEIMHIVLQHCFRQGERDHLLFNIACDIVVNSNILLENNMSLPSITLAKYGESMHLAPDGEEGHLYTAEEVYEMFPKPPQDSGKSTKSEEGSDRRENGATGDDSDPSDESDAGNADASGGVGGTGDGKKKRGSSHGGWDNHDKWGKADTPEMTREIWAKRLIDAAEAIAIRDPDNSRGLLPGFAKRMLEELRKPQTDWRTILNEFVQEEISDYSFCPPDRRFEGDFFLPDFNEKDESVNDILFMIDTSASMSDKMITAAYSEILGAIEQFGGKLQGWLGFFDAVVVEPRPFTSTDELRIIRPIGGGGTNFSVIFEYVKKHMKAPPVSIVILTDGIAPYPPESDAMGIPTLWLLNNESVTPPWGKIARIKL